MKALVLARIVFVMALASALTNGIAVAGGWEQSVDLTAGTEHDSNPAMSVDSEGSVWRGRIAPRYSLVGNFGRDEYGATLGLLAEQSSNEQLSNRRRDKNGSLHWARAFDSGSLRFGVRADEASTRSTEFEDSGLVRRESTRSSESANLNGDKELSEVASLTFGVSHAESKYEDAALSNYLNQAAEIGLDYAVSESLSTTARLSATEFDPDGLGIPSTTYSLSFGVSAQSGDGFKWAAQYGFRHTVAETEKNGSDGSLSLHWNGATNEFYFAVNRQFSPSSVGSMSVVDSVRGAWRSQWGPKSKSSIDLSSTKRHGELATKTEQAIAAFIYDTSAVSSIRIYVQEKRLEQANSVAAASIIGASLAYNWRP